MTKPLYALIRTSAIGFMLYGTAVFLPKLPQKSRFAKGLDPWQLQSCSKTIRPHWESSNYNQPFSRGEWVEDSEGSEDKSPLSVTGESAAAFLPANEQKIIQMVADGVSLRVIAQRLEIRRVEVRASLYSIFEKLAICRRPELLSRKVPR